MASTKPDTNSSRNSERAARSNFMASSFRAGCPATASRSAPDIVAKPVAEAGEHNDVGCEHRPAQQRELLFERAAFLGACGGIARPDAALDKGHQGPIGHG